MFLFRLPFILLRLPFKLLGLVLSVVMIPLTLLMRNFYLLLILTAVGGIYYYYNKSDIPAQVTPAQPAVQNQQRNASPKAPIIIDPVRRRENGDSAFATDLYAKMNEQERAYYSQLYFWAMENLASGKAHAWQNGNTSGTIMPVDSFINSSRKACRHFQETLKVHEIEQQLSGIACQADARKWCKLKPNATPSCGLGYQPGFVDSLKNLF